MNRELEQKQGDVLTGYFYQAMVRALTCPWAFSFLTTGVSYQSHIPEQSTDIWYRLPPVSDLNCALLTTPFKIFDLVLICYLFFMRKVLIRF